MAQLFAAIEMEITEQKLHHLEEMGAFCFRALQFHSQTRRPPWEPCEVSRDRRDGFFFAQIRFSILDTDNPCTVVLF